MKNNHRQHKARPDHGREKAEQSANLAVFPNIEFDEMERTEFHVFQQGDFDSEECIGRLLTVLWSDPESPAYYYQALNEPRELLFDKAVKDGFVKLGLWQRHYYKHPASKSGRDYFRIMKCDGDCQLEKTWYGKRTPECDKRYCSKKEKEIAEKGPEYARISLKLSEYKREELNLIRRIDIEQKLQGNKNAFAHESGEALPAHKGLAFDEKHQCVYIDDVREDLNDEQLVIFRELWGAQGRWVPGAVLHERAAKIKYSMPARLRKEIGSHKRQGYRLKRFLP
jgi:hypothetical protein